MGSIEFNTKFYFEWLPKLSKNSNNGFALPKAIPSLPKPVLLNPQQIEEPLTEEMTRYTAAAASPDMPTGAGYCAVLLDTGVNHHPAFRGNVINNFTTNTDEPEDKYDLYGHGTAMAGIIASKVKIAKGMGLAPDAKIISIKITRRNSGTTKWSSVYKGLLVAKALVLEQNKKEKERKPSVTLRGKKVLVPNEKIAVVNLSFNGLDFQKAFQYKRSSSLKGKKMSTGKMGHHRILQVIDELAELNVPVVISSGNQYAEGAKSGLGYPACGDQAFHAGASINYEFGDVDPKRISMSSQRIKSTYERYAMDPMVRKGMANFIHAPGAVAVSLPYTTDNGETIAIQTGSSVAAAIVSATVLLMRQASEKSKTPVTIQDIRRCLFTNTDVFLNGRIGVSDELMRNMEIEYPESSVNTFFDNKEYCALDIKGAIDCIRSLAKDK